MKNRTLTFELVRQLFDYDEESGILRWKTRVANCIHIGDIAGTISGPLGNQYVTVFVGGAGYRAHRIIWCWKTGKWPEHVVDHADGDTFNNKWANLRACTQAENCRNKRIGSDNTSGYKGADLMRSGRYRSQICVDRKKIYLGMFDTAEEAHAAYVRAAAEYHGEFARAA